MPYEYGIFIVIFGVGLLLLAFGYSTKNAALVICGSVLWLSLGVLTLMGQSIQYTDSTQVSYTFANISQGENVTTCINGFFDPFTSRCAQLNITSS